MDTELGVTQCFISYVHNDNDTFGKVAERLKSDLSSMYAAHTGRRLEIFLDRESIGWGSNWAQEIRRGVENATIMIPLITLRYFQSESCRSELLTFYSNAQQLGVTELIAPIILAGADKVSSDSSSDEMKLIASLQYIDIEEAWVEGYESPQWRRALHKMVLSIEKALLRAETSLLKDSVDDLAKDRTGSDSKASSVVADATEMISAVLEVESLANDATASLGVLRDQVEKATKAIESAPDPKKKQRVLIASAASMRAPAEDYQAKSQAFEESVVHLDGQIRAFFAELGAISIAAAQGTLTDLRKNLRYVEKAEEAKESIEGFIESVKYASAMNVSVRKAVEPALRGATATRNALTMMAKWADL